jgi:hypothetical protein
MIQHKALLQEILQERAVSSRGRRMRRGVKRKISKFPVIRSRQRAERMDLPIRVQILK